MPIQKINDHFELARLLDHLSITAKVIDIK
jgi:hypothetical protein